LKNLLKYATSVNPKISEISLTVISSSLIGQGFREIPALEKKDYSVFAVNLVSNNG
jgi:hypothetical protein